jgi:hypothetical protein
VGVDESRDEGVAGKVELPLRLERGACLRGWEDALDAPPADGEAVLLQDVLLVIDGDDPLGVDEEIRVHGDRFSLVSWPLFATIAANLP